MFGYVKANISLLTKEQLERYRAYYCGLCRTLGERYGEASRMALSYDMTFLVMLLSSMYEPENLEGDRRCAVHPAKRRHYRRNACSEYAAGLSVALAYYNCLDDWHDGRSVSALAAAKALKGAYETAKGVLPRQCAAIERCMSELAEIEQRRSPDPDEAANCFGEMLGELFVWREDMFAPRFRAFGAALGRFIYMMDAAVDLEKDLKRGAYNPFALMGGSPPDDESLSALLTLLIGECTMEFEPLPILEDVDIMRNILYSGVWTRLEIKKRRKGKAEDDKRPI